MRPIQMVDLKQQYSKIKKDVDTAIHEVLESAAFINGKAVTDFAQSMSQYLGVKHVIPCANGTDALQIAMMALDLRQSKMRLQWRTFMPGSLVVVGGAILMAVYFWKVTGNPFRMPYQVAFEQYAAGGMFFWQPLRSVSYRVA